MAAVLRRVDVLATPTTPRPAPTFASVHDPDFPFARSNMAPFNMSGLPALALPCGGSASGLPAPPPRPPPDGSDPVRPTPVAPAPLGMRAGGAFFPQRPPPRSRPAPPPR